MQPRSYQEPNNNKTNQKKPPKTKNNPQNTPNHTTHPRKKIHHIKSGPGRIRTGGFRLVKAAS